MEVGHTKFGTGEGFGSIRQHVNGRVDIFCIQEMKNAITASSRTNRCIAFPVEDGRNGKR